MRKLKVNIKPAEAIAKAKRGTDAELLEFGRRLALAQSAGETSDSNANSESALPTNTRLQVCDRSNSESYLLCSVQTHSLKLHCNLYCLETSRIAGRRAQSNQRRIVRYQL